VKIDEQEMRNTHRRVVTGNINGKSVVQSDERLSTAPLPDNVVVASNKLGDKGFTN
jgi:hypothetical protein